MTPLALGLVLVAAILHATWNLASKRATSGLPFVWATGVLSFVLWTPVVVVYFLRWHPVITWIGVGFMALSGVLHCGYSIFLQRAYRAGDFSLVYPLARGTGPLLSSLAAIIVLGERPTPLALLGAAIIIGSIFFLTGGPALWRGHPHGQAIVYGVCCGVFIASYTVADRQGVVLAAVSPLLLDWGGNLARTLIFAPFAARRWREVKASWAKNKRESLIVAVLGPMAYILVLWAMTFSPLSYLAPIREVSILIGAYFGARLFKEGDRRRRMIATLGMAAGVIALALG
jgi:drug/metabolite transporter (DMT)-like permease